MIIYIDKTPLIDLLSQYSAIATASSEIDGTPLWGETNAWSSGSGFFISLAFFQEKPSVHEGQFLAANKGVIAVVKQYRSHAIRKGSSDPNPSPVAIVL